MNKLKRLTQKQFGVQRIARIRDKEGELQHDPANMSEVFARFYEDL